MKRGGFQVSSSLVGTPGSLELKWHHSVVPLETWHPGSRWSLTKGRGPVAQALSQGHLSGDEFVGDRDESAWWGAGGLPCHRGCPGLHSEMSHVGLGTQYLEH